MKKNLIELTNVTKKYKTKAGEFTALSNINLKIKKSEFVAVVGKSGSGKSTLLNLLSGIDNPTSGEIIVNDIPIHKLNENKKALWRGKNLGIVFQFFQLLPTLSILENVVLPMDFCNYLPFGYRRDRALSLLEKVGIADHAYKLPDALSGGEQQRAAIARAIANDPQIIVADEPTGNLDSYTADQIFNLFLELNKEGKTVIMVTHEKERIDGLTKTILLSDGMIFKIKDFTGKKEGLYAESKN